MHNKLRIFYISFGLLIPFSTETSFKKTWQSISNPSIDTLATVGSLTVISGIAALIGIPVGLFLYTVKRHGGWNSVLSVKMQDLYLLKCARNHNGQELKKEIIKLNERFVGTSWYEQKSSLLHELVSKGKHTFIKKYGESRFANIEDLLNIYVCAYNLWFGKSFFNFSRSFTDKIYKMNQLDDVLGIRSLAK